MSEPSDVVGRFEAKVNRSGECHRWTAGHNINGYGVFRMNSQWQIGAHVAALLLAGIEVPQGMTVDHVWAKGCRHRDCVRVDHLEIVTNHENILRGNNRAARNARMTHCPRGHELAGDNLYIRSCGRRTCLTCKHARERAGYARRKQAQAA